MSETMAEEIKRLTAKRKSALVIEIIQGKTTAAAASRTYDLAPSEIEGWVEDARKGMENALKTNPLDARSDTRSSSRTSRRPMASPCRSSALEEGTRLAGCGGRQVIRSIRQGLLDEGVTVSIVKLRAWFGVPRRTVCCKPTRAAPKIDDPAFTEPIKELVEKEPAFGDRTVAWLLGFTKNTVQRIFQIEGWQVRKRPVGARPRIEAMPSVAEAPNERWSTDLCRVRAGKDRWATLELVMDCHPRELLGWHLSKSGKASKQVAALQQALIARFGTPGRVERPFLLRSDNGLVLTSRDYTKMVRSHGLKQEFITPHCPQQNGMMERLIRSLIEQCVHRQRFESLAHASRAVGDWIHFYNHRRPHRALGMRTPAAACELAA